MSNQDANHDLPDDEHWMEHLGEITDAIVAMAQMDFDSPPIVRGNGPFDAVAVGLIALGEELQASVAAQREAEEANESKAQFLANISHELRTPLTAILGSAELLQNTALDDTQKRYVKQLRDAGDLLLRLITDVLDFSKINAGKLRITNGPFCLRDCLNRVVAPYREQCVDKGVELVDGWIELEDVHVSGDEHRIEQVLSNIVGNAVKYTADGRIELRGSIEESKDGLLLNFEIQDTGLGISVDHHERIFDRFSMVDGSNRRRQSGAGLGLSIAKSLVDTMGGNIAIESTLGHGSTFFVQIPARYVQLESSSREGSKTAPVTDFRVLVVDDTPMVRAVATDMLQALGCFVEVAVSGAEALRKVSHQEFDLILMDCQMPEMDGLETARRILSLYPDRNLNIVAMTAHASERDQALSRAAGMVDHLNKPFFIAQLAELIQR